MCQENVTGRSCGSVCNICLEQQYYIFIKVTIVHVRGGTVENIFAIFSSSFRVYKKKPFHVFNTCQDKEGIKFSENFMSM